MLIFYIPFASSIVVTESQTMIAEMRIAAMFAMGENSHTTNTMSTNAKSAKIATDVFPKR